MAKFKNIFTNIFTKTNTKLETDAAIIPHRAGDSAEDKDEDTNSSNNVSALTEPDETRLDPNPSSSGGHQTTSVVPFSGVASDQQLGNPPGRVLTQNIVNNVQNNALTAPQTSITNATGVQVYQIKNARNVHIGHSFTFNSANTEEDRTRSPATANGPVKWANLKLSDTIRQMMDCEDDLDTDMMIAISRHLGYEWKQFARVLEYSEGQIEAFECDNDTLSERIYQFILDWSRNDDEPTLGKMVKLLWEHMYKETVYHMKLVWKKRQQNQTE